MLFVLHQQKLLSLMKKSIILAKARLSLVYLTSGNIFSEIANCDDRFELEDYLEIFEIIKKWCVVLELKINGLEIDKKIFSEYEYAIKPKEETAVNAFCALNSDFVHDLAEAIQKHEDDHCSRLKTWIYIPARHIKNLLLVSVLFSSFDDENIKCCCKLCQLKPMVEESVNSHKIALGCDIDITF